MQKSQLIINTIGQEGFDFFAKHVPIEQTVVLATHNIFNIKGLEGNQKAIVNLARINDIKKLNNFLKEIIKKKILEVFI